MQMEISEAADFLCRLLQSKLDQSMLQAFKQELADLLKQRFVDHWDPQLPYRGNGFRAISNFNGQLDPVLVLAAENAAVPPALIHAHLPRDFVLWIDPFSVSYRVGDHGNIMTLYEDESRGRITPKPQAPSYIRPRTSTPIRISPPSSPENRKVKNHIHQSSPLAKVISSEQEQPQPQQQQPQQQQPQQPQQQQQQLVLAN